MRIICVYLTALLSDAQGNILWRYTNYLCFINLLLQNNCDESGAAAAIYAASNHTYPGT